MNSSKIKGPVFWRIVVATLTMLVFAGFTFLYDYNDKGGVLTSDIVKALIQGFVFGFMFVLFTNAKPPRSLKSVKFDETLKRLPQLGKDEFIQMKILSAKSAFIAQKGILTVSNKRLIFLPYKENGKIISLNRNALESMKFHNLNKTKGEFLKVSFKKKDDDKIKFWIDESDKARLMENLSEKEMC